MKMNDIIDARNGDYVIAKGLEIRTTIKSKIGLHQDALKNLMDRMNNECSSKEMAIGLMVALKGDALNEKALFFEACVTRAAYLEGEIKYLDIIGSTFINDQLYKLSVADCERFGW